MGHSIPLFLFQIQPPAGFLEKIHERLETRSGFNGILRKLFVPLHINIPLELVAAATITILVVLVFNIQRPEIQMMQTPIATTSQRLGKKPKEDRIESVIKMCLNNILASYILPKVKSINQNRRLSR